MTMTSLWILYYLVLGLWTISCKGFANSNRFVFNRRTSLGSDATRIPRSISTPHVHPPSFMTSTRVNHHSSPRKRLWIHRLWDRFDTIKSAGLSPDSVKTAGLFRRIKDIHNPITYLLLALLAGFRWDWCFRNPYYWFGVGFCIKWYRARYVFKIPVWDRQPNWNNIITSKEQEKDLKALTCKNCGSTLFIAKTREFFFEGSTGIGGLGCFSCGAKGKDNFYEDRDRIVEEVADIDDYFDYERPLDFVSRAERRKLLKEAKGDEEVANQILLDRTTAVEQQAQGDQSSSDTTVLEQPSAETAEESASAQIQDASSAEVKTDEEPVSETFSKPHEEDQVNGAAPKAKAKPTANTPKEAFDLDALDMDAF